MTKNIMKRKTRQRGKKNQIDIDQPFDYEEVAEVAGTEYARNLRTDDFAIRPYEEVKENISGFYFLENTCIWMQAGVISFRLCDNEYDCDGCVFNESMRRAMGDQTPPQIKGSSLKKHGPEKIESVHNPCIHFMTGRIKDMRECNYDYQCYGCKVHEQFGTHRPPEPEGSRKITYMPASGYKVADRYYYHFGHSWVHIIHGSLVKIGMDDFIAKVFGKGNKLELPQVGDLIRQGYAGWSMRKNGHDALVQAPLTGKIVSVNEKVVADPAIAHDAPYDAGWLFHLEPWFLKRELKGLYFGEDCQKWIEKENQQLLGLLGSKYERLAAMGGEAADDLVDSFPEIGWDRLVQQFLKRGEKKGAFSKPF